MKTEIRVAGDNNYDFIFLNDKHLRKEEINRKIENGEIYILSDDNKYYGWLRFGFFWDNTPFMNMLFILEPFRYNGFGKMLVEFWENQMKTRGFDLAMTSTLSNEKAQHFYRKLGYKDAGSLLLPGEPLEIILVKAI